jgi:putative flippase GtrA
MNTIVRQVIGYAAASLSALAIDMGTLWALVHIVHWHYLVAATASFLAGTVVAYLLSITLAFKEHRLLHRRTEFAGFVAIGAAGLAIHAGVMSIAFRHFGLHYMIAKCLAAVFTFTGNFAARRQLLFSSPFSISRES